MGALSPHPRSPLARLHTTRRPPERVARDGWKDHRILAVSESDPRLDDVDRAMVRALATKLFGTEAV